MRERTGKLQKLGISKDRYMELKYIARQYDAMREAERKLRAGEIDRERRSGDGLWHGRPDPTAAEAMHFATKSMGPRIRAIEDAARAAAGDVIGQYVMRNVTRGQRYEDMAVPCGRKYFFECRRRFFVELDRRV